MQESDTAPEPSSTASPTTGGAKGSAGTSTGLVIARNSLWMMVDSLGAVVASLYCSVAVARNLGPDLMGQYNYVLYFATVLKMVAEMAIPATVRKFSAEFVGRGDYGTVRALVRQTLRIQSRMGSVVVAVGLAVVFTAFPAQQRLVAVLAVLSIVPAMILSPAAGALAATESVRHNVVSSLGGIAANLVGVTVSVLAGWGLVGLTASLLVSRVVDCAIRLTLYRRVYATLPGGASRKELEEPLRRRMVRFAANQLVLGLLYALLFDRMEVFFLKGLASAPDIAFFSISFTLVSYTLQIPMNLAGSAQVSMWVQQGRSPAEAARTTGTATWFVLFLGTPLLFGVAAAGDPLLRLLYGAKYLPAIPVLTVLAILSLGLAVSQPAQFLIVGAERQRFYLIWLTLAGLVSVLANVLLIPRLGAVGAAFAKGVGGIFGAAGFLGYLVVNFRVELPYRRMARLLLAGGAMFVLVRLVGTGLPPLAALLVGIPVGVATFLVLTRWLRVLDDADHHRLMRLDRLLPARARAGYAAVVRFLVPRPLAA